MGFACSNRGALALYLGRNYRIEMVEVDSDKIEFPQTFFVLAVVTTAKFS
jgi:hypothetical protein